MKLAMSETPKTGFLASRSNSKLNKIGPVHESKGYGESANIVIKTRLSLHC